MRGSLSRAYYSAYSELSRTLLAMNVQMPQGREGPAHAKVLSLTSHHLSRHLSMPQIGRLCFLLTELYRLRIMADYFPRFDISDWDARYGIGYLTETLGLLERIP